MVFLVLLPQRFQQKEIEQREVVEKDAEETVVANHDDKTHQSAYEGWFEVVVVRRMSSSIHGGNNRVLGSGFLGKQDFCLREPDCVGIVSCAVFR